MMKVYIAQLKCPSNHCVLGLYGEFIAPEEASATLAFELGKAMAQAVEAGILKHRCEMCGSTDLHVQVAPTIFRTMEEARGPLAQLEAEQAETRRFLKGGKN